MVMDIHKCKSNTPLHVEVNVPKKRPCKLRAKFFTQENFATPEALAWLRAWWINDLIQK